MKLALKILACIVITFVLWVGGAQIGVHWFPRADIALAVFGMVLGVRISFWVLET